MHYTPPPAFRPFGVRCDALASHDGLASLCQHCLAAESPPAAFRQFSSAFPQIIHKKIQPSSPREEALQEHWSAIYDRHSSALLSNIFKVLLLLFIIGSCKHSPCRASALCAWDRGWVLPFQWCMQSMSKYCRIWDIGPQNCIIMWQQLWITFDSQHLSLRIFSLLSRPTELHSALRTLA